MAFTLLRTDIVRPGLGVLNRQNAPDETFILTESGSIISTNSSAVLLNGENSVITVVGDIIAKNAGIAAIAPGVAITVAQAGTIQSVDRTTDFGAVRLSNDFVTLANAGSILSTHSVAVEVTNIVTDLTSGAVGNAVTNSGTIVGSTGVLVGYGMSSTTILQGPFSLLNTGDILATGQGDGTTFEANGAGVFVNMRDAAIVNGVGGTIASTAVDGAAILAGAAMAQDGSYGSEGLTVTNHGEILSSQGPAIDLRGTFPGPDPFIFSATIINHGAIASGLDDQLDGTVAIYGGEGDEVVSNSGNITGNILLGGGDDVYVGWGAGEVIGLISGGDGEDELVGGTGTDIMLGDGGRDLINGRDGDDFLEGNAGADTIRGGWGDDFIDGGAASDQLFGNGGDDTLLGGGGDNTLSGGLGDDTLQGGGARDTILGNRDDDVLRGGAGDDRLLGQRGDDTLEGGAGRDILLGGQDADVFIWSSQSESGIGAASDVVIDFQLGLDKLDLAGLGPDIAFIGGSAFAGTGSAEIRAMDMTNGGTRLMVDVNGDGLRDMHIVLNGAQGFTADDFLL